MNISQYKTSNNLKSSTHFITSLHKKDDLWYIRVQIYDIKLLWPKSNFGQFEENFKTSNI